MNKKKNSSIQEEKALFIQRLTAFLIDTLIVSVIVSVVSLPFVDSKKIKSLNEKSYEIVEKFNDEEISANEYTVEYLNITYELAKSNGMVTIIGIIVGLLLYVAYPLYHDGQSLGKKLLKIKIISDNGYLSMNQLMFRSFIANSILLDLLSVVLMIICGRNAYIYTFVLFAFIQYLIIFISIFMIIYGKEGRAVHDRLTHTRVVRI